MLNCMQLHLQDSICLVALLALQAGLAERGNFENLLVRGVTDTRAVRSNSSKRADNLGDEHTRRLPSVAEPSMQRYTVLGSRATHATLKAA
jgi:hypothetical protein